MAATDDNISQFRERITGRRVNESTAGKYARWARRFEMWRPGRGPDLDNLIDFDSVLADDGWTDYPWENTTGRPSPDEYAYRSRRVALSAVKLWCRIHHGVRIEEEVQYIVGGEPDPFEPDYISREDVKAVVDGAPDECNCAGCEAALRLTYDAILRAAELTLLTTDDIDLDAGTVDVTSVKGSMNATLGISDETAAALRRHLRENDPAVKLFTNTYGNGWKPSSWCSHVRKNHHEVGAHSLGRHTPIVHRLESGEDFGRVYQRARHRHPEMTSRYARVIDIEIPDWARD